MISCKKRVALLSISPDIAENGGLNTFPSYGVRRVQAGVTASPATADAEVVLFDTHRPTVAGFVEQLLRFQPDIVGFATYIWSIGIMTDVARAVKRTLPECMMVFGGPSARTEVFDLEPYKDYREYVDALVLSDGEEGFHDIVALSQREMLKNIPGLALPGSTGWIKTPRRVPNPNMDSIASPFQGGLMPANHVAYIETFRGCPLSCSFCQWGVMDVKRKFSQEYLVRELRAMKEIHSQYAFIVDAGLNLNMAAFRNLFAAEKEVGFFNSTPLLCEIYPSLLRPEHLAFLERTRWVQVGLGLQSLDPAVLDINNRPFKPDHLRPVINQISEFGLVDVELILGLPGDTPESFRRTLEEALTLPCNVRVYRCLILPEGLLTRPPQGADIHFDPHTLIMTSCSTWPEKELIRMHEYVTRMAESIPFSYKGEHWWHFIHQTPKYQQACAPLGAHAGSSVSHG